MDVKGDLSGIAKPGEEKSFITERQAKINLPYSPKGFPVELMFFHNRMAFAYELLSRSLDLFCFHDSRSK